MPCSQAASGVLLLVTGSSRAGEKALGWQTGTRCQRCSASQVTHLYGAASCVSRCLLVGTEVSQISLGSPPADARGESFHLKRAMEGLGRGEKKAFHCHLKLLKVIFVRGWMGWAVSLVVYT